MKNWKTTLFGAGGMIPALLDIITGFVLGTPDAIHWGIDISAITAGIGLIMAKDHSTTGTGL